MNDYYVEVLVKRDVEKEKKKRRIIIIVIMLFFAVLGITTKFSIFYVLFLLSLLGYFFLVHNYHIEFEYFYMNGELTISKIVNKSRRKKVLELNDGVIKLIAPINSNEMKPFDNIKAKDCTANKPLDRPYTIVYMYKGELKKADIQMTDNLYKEFKRDMPYKVMDY